MADRQKEEIKEFAEFYKNLHKMKGIKKKRGTFGFPYYLSKKTYW